MRGSIEFPQKHIAPGTTYRFWEMSPATVCPPGEKNHEEQFANTGSLSSSPPQT